MTKNPLANAVAAFAYIAAIATFLSYSEHGIEGAVPEFMAGIVFISLLVLSVAVMAYAFFMMPVSLFLSGKHQEGIELFGKTVLSFAGILILTVVVAYAASNLSLN